jgi:predicted secreted hydrolase
MAFQLRREDGSIDPFSSGTLIRPDGTTRRLSRDELDIRVEDSWQSPYSEATYPARWRVTVPSEDLAVTIEPYVAGLELNVSYAYWEGAVRVKGQHGGRAVQGSGYVELTGYAGSMAGQF